MNASLLDLIMCMATWIIPIALLGLVSWQEKRNPACGTRHLGEGEGGRFVALPSLNAGRSAFVVPPLMTLRDTGDALGLGSLGAVASCAR